MFRYKIFNYALCVSIGLFLVSCDDPETEINKTTKQQIPGGLQAVEVVNPKRRSFLAEINITGTAKPNQQVFLMAMESGRIKKILKDIGDQVMKGEILALLENPELNRDLERIQAQLKSKKLAYERLNSTYQKTPDLVPKQQVEMAEAEYLSLRAENGAITDRISFLRVRAPFQGLISQRFVDVGAIVQSGISNSQAKPLFEILDNDPIRLIIPLPESDAAVIKKGTKVSVLFPELPQPSVEVEVSRTANSLDPASKTMEVQIDIPNPKGDIKTGMYAKVLIHLKSRNNILSLPHSAEQIIDGGFFLLMVEKDRVKRVPFRKGISNKGFFEILNPEIGEDDLFIIQGKSLVSPGQKVEPILKSNEK